MHDVTLIADDISCEHCQRSIEGGLAQKPGVESVVVDIAARSVRVQYDDAVTDENALLAELEELGYPAHSG